MENHRDRQKLSLYQVLLGLGPQRSWGGGAEVVLNWLPWEDSVD